MIDLSSYEPAWPVELFVSEANLIVASASRDWTSKAELLLTEAFH
ncbi:hypothetical protein [Sinosporangium siamense]|nr:hypothetical protein [Sinosporangium siamense]